MSAFWRKQTSPHPVESASTSPPAPQAETAPYVDRSLIILTTKLQACIERLDNIDARLDELEDQLAHAPSHSDILEVRMHSAKLAAEMARTTIALRSEIGMANEEVRRAARAAQQPVVDPINVPNLDLVHDAEKLGPYSASA